MGMTFSPVCYSLQNAYASHPSTVYFCIHMWPVDVLEDKLRLHDSRPARKEVGEGTVSGLV